ncbi:MAG: VWA domain-containing protein [Candidatus Poribacteria bacterium]|nr:VWA domain-containing protein [Candidatus Poribacteria bacterium]
MTTLQSTTLAARQEQIVRSKTRRRSALLLSLIFHVIAVIIYLFVLQQKPVKDEDSIAVEWVKDVPKPKLRQPKTKPPLKKTVRRPDELLAREAKNKLAESSPNKIREVMRLSERIVYKNIEVNTAAPSEKIPELMTDAQLRDAEASNLERLVSHRGPVDGQGKVTGRVRVPGQRNGMFGVDSYGDSIDGLLGGGGNSGIGDKLGIIDFLDEFEGPQNIVYCLDVSASMQVAGLKKLELALQSIKQSLRSLGSDDNFNIVTFSAQATLMSKSLLPATLENIEIASKYLNRFTPERIANYQGTNLLAAVEKALETDTSVIVLVTDGVPTAGQNTQVYIETDSRKILETVRAKNVNNASIYVIGLEINLHRPMGAQLLVSLTDQNNGKFKLIDSEQLAKHPKTNDNPLED